MVARQPRGIPTGGEFASNEHGDALSDLPPEEDYLSLTASDLRAGDRILFDKFDDDLERDVTTEHVVARVETGVKLDWSTLVTVTFADGGESDYNGRTGLRVRRDASVQLGAPARTPRELRAEFREVSRAIRAGEDTPENRERAIAAANDPGADAFIGASAVRVADMYEHDGQHDTAMALRAAAERIRLSYDSTSGISQHDDLMSDPRTPASLLLKVVRDKPSAALLRNPNASAESLDALAASHVTESEDVRRGIAEHPNASAELSVRMRS